MAVIDSVIRGLSEALDPVGYVPDWPEFAIEKSLCIGGMVIDAGHIDGWNTIQFSRHGVVLGVLIAAYSDEWFALRQWGAELSDLGGIMRKIHMRKINGVA